jgi:hypothetical protein
MKSRAGLPLSAHAAIEPLAGLLFILAPFIFGFNHTNDAKTVSIVLGVLVILTGLMTRWRMAIVAPIPLAVHRSMDLAVGALAILSPFVFAFSHNGAATRFLIIMGIAEIGAALATNWDARQEFATPVATEHGRPPERAPDPPSEPPPSDRG